MALPTGKKTTVAYATTCAKPSGTPTAPGSPGLPRGIRLATVIAVNVRIVSSSRIARGICGASR